jgi:hypothetical protein
MRVKKEFFDRGVFKGQQEVASFRHEPWSQVKK